MPNTTILSRAATVTEVTGQIDQIKGHFGHFVEIRSYDCRFDTFAVSLHDAGTLQGCESLVPACLLPYILRECGEPDEFVGRTFLLSL